jgi:TRAP-type C4-dicarboxylate transport system substrate-binding protein
MVRTRSSARGFLFDQLSQEQQYQLQEIAQQSGLQHGNSQEASQDNAYEYNGNDDMETDGYHTNRPTYRQGDQCKRHRVRDSHPDEVDVVSYRRRKPM